MTDQPKALWLAEYLENCRPEDAPASTAAAELRRLHEVNADMLSALRAIVAVAETENSFSMQNIKDCANIAIKQATGEHNG